MKKWPFFAFGIPALVIGASVTCYYFGPKLFPDAFSSSNDSSISVPTGSSRSPSGSEQTQEVTSLTPQESLYHFVEEHPIYNYTTKEGAKLTFEDSGNHFSYKLKHVDSVAPGQDLVIPSEVSGVPVVGINDYAGSYIKERFTGKKLVIEEGISSMGIQVFKGFPCEELVLPSSITKVTTEAFADTRKLEKITWGGNIQEIDYGAFRGHNMHKVVLPDTLRNLGGEAFLTEGIDDLEIVINDALQSYSFADYTVSKVVFPAECSVIPGSCFKSVKGLKEIVLQKPVTEIQGMAFYDTDLSNLPGPLDLSECKSLGSEVFARCKWPGLVVDISGMESLGRDIFSGAEIGGVRLGSRTYDNLGLILRGYRGSISVSEGSPYAIYGHDIYSSDYSTLLCTSASSPSDLGLHPSCTILGPLLFYVRCEVENVAIPDQIQEIGANCFAGNHETIKTVNLNNVVKVGDNCFNGCRALESVTSAGVLQSVGGYSFSDCKALTSFPLDILTSIGSSAFASTAFSSIKTGPNLVELGSSAFSWMVSSSCVVDLSASMSLETIPYYLFSHSEGISRITLPSSIKEIGQDWCTFTQVKSFAVPNSLERLGPYALQGMSVNDFRSTNLSAIGRYCFVETTFSTVYVPATLTYLEERAFAGGKITTVSYAGTRAQWDAITKGGRLGGGDSLTINCTDDSFIVF